MWRRKVIVYLANDPSFADDYQGSIRLGIERACVKHDLDLWVYGGRAKWSESNVQDRLYEFPYGGRVDGVVLCAATILVSYPLQEFIAALKRCTSAPIVSVGQHEEGISSVLPENTRGATQLAEHLVRVHGYRKIAYIAGPAGHTEAEDRLYATKRVLSRHGVTLPDEDIRYGDFSIRSGKMAAKDLLHQRYGFEVIIATNDAMAVGALEVLQEEGIKCPEQVALVGFDDNPCGRLAQPPLTTVRQPLMKMGESAVEQIVDIWSGGQHKEPMVIDTELLIRESCGCQTSLVALMNEGEPEGVSEERDIARALAGLFSEPEQQKHWARKLSQAIGYEQSGIKGSMIRIFNNMVDELPGGHLSVYDFQPVLGVILRVASRSPERSRVENALRAAGALVAMHAYRRPAERQLQSELLLEDMCAGWDLLSTAMSMPELKKALISTLQRLGILDALISCFVEGDHEHLSPFVFIRNGEVVELPEEPYPTSSLMPEGLFASRQRRTLSIMPLGYRQDKLGVAVMEFRKPIDLYRILREHICSALKVVRMHQLGVK